MGRRATPAAAGVFILAAVLLAGCAAPQVSALVARLPAGLPAAAEIASVPFHAQEDYQCGPASLAAVLQRLGTTIEQGSVVAVLVRATVTLPLVLAALASYVYLARAGGGTPQPDLERHATGK